MAYWNPIAPFNVPNTITIGTPVVPLDPQVRIANALDRIAASLEALVARGGPLAAPSTERRPSKPKIEGKRKRARASQTAPDKARSRRRLAVPPRGAPRA